MSNFYLNQRRITSHKELDGKRQLIGTHGLNKLVVRTKG